MDLGDINLFDPDTYVDELPHEQFAYLRKEHPVFRHEVADGGHFWCITRHEDLVTVNRDAASYSSWRRTALTLGDHDTDALEQQRMMMLNMDPPDHSKLRKIVNKGFTPRMIRELQEHLADEARQIVADGLEKGDVEFVEEIASELPLIAIAEFLGVPREDRKIIFDLSNRMIGSEDPDYQLDEGVAQEAAGEMYAYAQQLADDRRANPRNDIVTTLLQAEVDGERLDELEFNLFFMLLAVAGNETTRNAISHGMLALLENPDQQQILRDDPSKLDAGIEEILRWGTPVMQFRRQTTKPVTIAGVDIPEDEGIVFWHISANRDETVFDDPYSFQVERSPNLHTNHVAFGGGGPHFCLGANLARAEMKVVFAELLKQAKWEQREPARRLRSNFINGIKRLDVTLTPT
ncbi:cytochrome P450 [Aquihabitans sp. G128]|uniref:cytochrome P450 n=1 Tax=Aquihabitans sp. G128 TaxID=2849779 RepID=UPI001C2306D6|nr:cytochrome P450 [Aquihabitans sp. G128]QXC59610.1 cytochrome P450 [Aquihabitans sp. G128]